MPHKSRWSVDIPKKYLHSLIIGGPNETLPDTPAYVDCEDPENLHITWSQYALWSRRVAAGLQQAGLKQKDRVLVYSGNNIFCPVVFMGVSLAGGITTTANPAYVAREVAYQLKDCEPRFILVAESSIATALEAARSINYPTDQIFLFDDGPLLNSQQGVGDIRHWSCLISNIEDGRKFPQKEAESMDDLHQTVAILYSSGTTGVPKGVELTHYGLVANCVQMSALWDLDPRYSTRNPRREPQRMLGILPMYHGYGFLWFGTLAPYRHSSNYIMKRFSLVGMLRNIERFRITELTLAPPVVVMMNKSPESKKFDLSSVKKVQAGAAPLSREMCAALEGLWPAGQINVKQGWGMTEAPISILNWDDREISTTSAVGEPLANCEVKVMDEDGHNEVSPGERGELWCKSPTMMRGYWRKPRETSEVIMPDGWLRTGDIVYRDHEGKYVVVDRKKELIKVRGNQVAPAELEGVLLEHPDIQDAAVVGIKSGEDEEPLAYIVPKPGRMPKVDEVLSHMAERTAKIKRITGGIIFADDIPRNPSGKILRRLLRDRLADPKERAKAQRGQSGRSSPSAPLLAHL